MKMFLVDESIKTVWCMNEAEESLPQTIIQTKNHDFTSLILNWLEETDLRSCSLMIQTLSVFNTRGWSFFLITADIGSRRPIPFLNFSQDFPHRFYRLEFPETFQTG